MSVSHSVVKSALGATPHQALPGRLRVQKPGLGRVEKVGLAG